ncbi:MAG: hypothetical protein KAI18_02000 [Candidatus Aenigmarchaeota archaeon]|nr:hypothetical protein [Candidatus Aenigmarchaeota archaeon]
MAVVKPAPTEPFTFVFVAAVVIFFTLFLLFGQEPLSDTSSDNDLISSKGEIIFSADYLSLISNKTQSARTIDFGDFDVGHISKERTIESIDSLVVERGLFRSASKEFSFDGVNLEDAHLVFTVDDTNDYGNLRIYLNDEVVFDNKTVNGAEYTIEFNNLLLHNDIRVEAQSSGIRFWAPTTYILSDMKVSAASFDNVDEMYSFIVYDYEMAGFDAMLSYEVGAGSVRLDDFNVEINGNDINAEKRPMFGGLYKETFDRTDGVIAAKPDTNYIKFFADGDAMYAVEGVQLTITYFDSDKAAVSEYTVVVDEDTYDDMENKTIVLEYYVDKLSDDALLDVSLNEQMFNQKTVLYENQIVLGQDDFRRGKTNLLKFSTYGIYRLSDIDIRIVDDDNFKLF